MDDISFLVNETFKNIENKSSAEEIPASCGILYSLAQNDSTFVIRGVASRNLKLDHEQLFDKKINEPLRIEENSAKDVFFFETDFWELSELVLELASQKRFLKDGERLSNLSDPHLSWSVCVEEDIIRLDCTGRKGHRNDFQKLGYLGDSSIALARFSQLFGRNFKDTIEFSKTENTKLFSKIHDFLSLQIYDKSWFENHLESNFDINLAESLGLYLRELSTMMKFWIQVNSQIEING